MNQNFADMTAAQHNAEAAVYYKQLAHYATQWHVTESIRNEKLKEALMWATYHSEQAPIKQAAEWAANPTLKAAYDRKEAAGKRMRKAHEHSTYQEFKAAGAEWSAAYKEYQQLYDAANA